MTATGRELDRRPAVVAPVGDNGRPGRGTLPGERSLGPVHPLLPARGRLARRPLALWLRLAAGLDAGAAILVQRDGGRQGARRPEDWDLAALATGASLLAAAGRPQLRLGALVAAILRHGFRAVALGLAARRGRRTGPLALELVVFAALGGLLRQAVRAARWDR